MASLAIWTVCRQIFRPFCFIRWNEIMYHIVKFLACCHWRRTVSVCATRWLIIRTELPFLHWSVSHTIHCHNLWPVNSRPYPFLKSNIRITFILWLSLEWRRRYYYNQMRSHIRAFSWHITYLTLPHLFLKVNAIHFFDCEYIRVRDRSNNTMAIKYEIVYWLSFGIYTFGLRSV